MAFISLGKIDKNLIPILIGSIICFLDRFLSYFKEDVISGHMILLNIFIYFSYLFAIIPYIIYKNKSKNLQKSEKEKINKEELEYINLNREKYNLLYKLKYISIAAIIDFIFSICMSFSINIKTSSWIWQILFSSVLYYLISKVKLYRHHYLTIILIILLGFIIDIVLNNIIEDVNNNLFFLLLRLFKEILSSLFYVFNKFLIEKKFCIVYELVFISGFIELILFTIFSIFDYYFIRLDKYENFFNIFKSEELFVLLGIMTLQFGLCLSLLFTIKNNSPCHVFIIFTIGQFARYFLSIQENKIIIIIIICLLMILFLSLIFNEIIEINFCGLSMNTKRNITERALTEVSKESFIIGDDETSDANTEEDDNVIKVEDNEVYE